MRIPTTRVEACHTSSALGSRHHRQANYTALQRIGGCPVQPKRSCDSPSVVRAGLVAPPRQTGQPSLVTIGRPLIIFDWAKREFSGHSKARKPIRKSPVRRRQSERPGIREWIWSGDVRAPGWRVKVRSRKLSMSDHGSQVKKNVLEQNIQLSLPSMSRYSPLRPKKLRKYHERDETHRTSMSGVSIPRCSIDLNPRVRGNGSLTIRNKLG